MGQTTATSADGVLTSMMQTFVDGGLVMWPILGLAFVVFVLITERVLLYRRTWRANRMFGEEFFSLWPQDASGAHGLAKKKRAPLARAINALMSRTDESEAVVGDFARELCSNEIAHLERFLPMVATIGTILPILGLLGTVTGMIETFQVITVVGTGDPRALAGGISQALITTQAGLIIALPTYLLHTFLCGRVDRVALQFEHAVMRVAGGVAAQGPAKMQHVTSEGEKL